jgi:hypothetical protein
VRAHDISHQIEHTVLARTAGGRGLIVATIRSALGQLDSADVLIVRGPDGRRDAARFVATAEALSAEANHVVERAVRAAPGGEPLSAFIDDPLPAAPGGHDWGALGLADGPDTTVVPAPTSDRPNDLEVALASRGHALWKQDWQLRLVPGDRVHAGERDGKVVAIHRRSGTADIERTDGSIDQVDLDDVVPSGETQ